MKKVLQMGMTDNLGGIESFLINYYQEIDKRRFQFDFINIYDNLLYFQKEIEQLGGNVYKVPSYYKHPIKYLKVVSQIIKNQKYEIVHCNMNSAVFLYPLIAAKLGGAKLIISHSHNSSSDKGIMKELLHFINKHFISFFANYYLACSSKAGEWFYSKKILKSSNFKILNNSIDVQKFKFDQQARKSKREELQIQDSTLVIGHVGRFNKQKNHVFLIECFEKVHLQNPDSVLLLVGIGPLQEDIIKLVNLKKLQNNVIFLGQRNDVEKLMCAMDIFVLPSLYEGLPLVGVESQATGLICFFSDKITNELNITSNVKNLPIDNSDLWVENIMNTELTTKERNKIDVGCFNIKNGIINLYEIYMQEEVINEKK